jgi:large subunit ribosomal protein L25
MGDKLSLKLDERTVQGKKVAKLRQEGFVPGVIYGPGIDPINVQVAVNVMEKTYRQAGTHSPIHLTVGSKRMIAMIKEVDRDPVRGTMQHISFHAVNVKDPIVAEVPIRLIGEGESEAERNGLVVLQALEKIEVKALPMDLPEAIEISILALKEAGEKLTLAEVKLPKGVEFVEHDSGHGGDDEEKPSVVDQMVASVWEPAALQSANESAAGDAENESEVVSENGTEEKAVNNDAIEASDSAS